MPITDKLDNVIGKVAEIAGTTADYAASGHTIEEKVDYISGLLDGIASGGGGSCCGLVVEINVTASAMIMDKTWKEIHDAMLSGRAVNVVYSDSLRTSIVRDCRQINTNEFGVGISSDEIGFVATSEDGYPSRSYNPPT